jgi:hypothetical protein
MPAGIAGGCAGTIMGAWTGIRFEDSNVINISRNISSRNLLKWTGGIVLALSIPAAGGAAAFGIAYPGSCRGMVNQFLHATLHENRNLSFCINYWTRYMGLLAYDEQERVYGFARTPEAGMDEFERGKLVFHRGDFGRAAALIRADIDQSGESEEKLFWLAMSCMRQAEAENCLATLVGDRPEAHGAHLEHRHGSDGRWCSLPIVNHHSRAEFARTAAGLFEKLLDRHDSGNKLYQWLLNFNYMTIGRFPQDVPARYLIRGRFADAFYGKGKEAAEARFRDLAFPDRARELGVDVLSTGKGIAVEDFDGDGYLDLLTAGGEGIRCFRNNLGKGFIESTAAAGFADVRQPFIVTAADYDNDGAIDVFVGCPYSHYRLFRNRGDGTFLDVTAASGLLDGKPPGQVAATWVSAWADVNNDGYLDLFLAQWGMALPFSRGLLAQPRMDSKLFINHAGRFVDETREYGLHHVVNDQYFIGAAFGDYDSDGDADLFLSSPLRNTSVLLRNEAGRRFVTTDLIARDEGGFVTSFLDLNHDGRLDLFLSGFSDAKTSTEMAVFGEDFGKYHSGHTTVFLQGADGRFQDRSDFFDMPIGTMGASFGDLNNDGAYDFYLGTGSPESWFILPNLMYLGETEGTKCTGRTTNISMLHGFGTIQKGHGIVFFDFDNDGKQDVYSSLGGMWPADKWPSRFFVNQSDLKNAFIKIRLRGRKTNYYGVGATIKVVATNDRGEEIVRYHHMSNGTGFGSSPYLAHIGLLDATRLTTIDVYWPGERRWRSYHGTLGAFNLLDESPQPVTTSVRADGRTASR